jgi:hypothetical protein
MDTWSILWSFVIFFPVLVFCTKKNLATLDTQCGEKQNKDKKTKQKMSFPFFRDERAEANQQVD